MRRVAVIAGVVAIVVVAGFLTAAGGGSHYRVRAIFDTAAFVVKGEDVKIAGVRAGAIESLQVTKDQKAAVVLDITEPGFQDFREDATCKIRPQSLIGEQFVECIPTQPRTGAGEAPPELKEITEGPGKGQRLLPVEQTSTSVALDLIGNINRLPVRQRLSLILNELGVGVAGRGQDLNDVIRRAAPALTETNKVLEILASQNRVLKKLAVDSDTILEPLARERRSIGGFVQRSTEVGAATADRRADLELDLQKLPTFLAELEPTMQELGNLADQMTPVVTDLGAGARDINDLIRELGPFSEAGTPALVRLGEVGKPGIPALRASLPIVKDLRAFARQLRPVAKDLGDTLASFRRNNGIERLLDYAYFQVQAINGYDSVGHFLRAGLIVNTCSTYTVVASSECLANFKPSDATRELRSNIERDPVLERTARVLAGEDPEDVLPGGRAQQRKREQELREGKVPSILQEQLDAQKRIDEAAADAGTKGKQDEDRPFVPGATPTPSVAAPGMSPEQMQQLLDFFFGQGSLG